MEKLELPEQVIKADVKRKGNKNMRGIEAEVSKMGVLGTPSQLDMEAVKRMLEELDKKGL